MNYVLIDYTNGKWRAKGLDSLVLHDVGPGVLEEIGTERDAYEQLQKACYQCASRRASEKHGGRPTTVILKYVHTNGAYNRLVAIGEELARRDPQPD